MYWHMGEQHLTLSPREHWLIYRGWGFLAVICRIIRLLANPLTTSPMSKLSLFLSLLVCRQSRLLTGYGGGVGGGRGAKSYDRINISILSITTYQILSLHSFSGQHGQKLLSSPLTSSVLRRLCQLCLHIANNKLLRFITNKNCLFHELVIH